jgi:stage III sporulation protein AB
MMIKWLGAMLILIAGTSYGFIQAAQYARRPREIRHLIHALNALETEIMYGVAPLPQAFSRVVTTVPKPIADLFEQAASRMIEQTSELTGGQCWKEAIAAVWPYTAMKHAERESLLALTATLGISDRMDQAKHIRLAMTQLQTEEAIAREEQSRYEKMWKSLGLLASALVVILMY